jgi:hypothetical protein
MRVMRKLDPLDVLDKLLLSEILCACLNEMTNKCKGFTAQKFAKAINISASELTRMKLYHQKPHSNEYGYARSICFRTIRKAVLHVLEFFPDLKIFQRNKGCVKAVFPVEKLASLRTQTLLIKNGLVEPVRMGRPPKSKTYEKDYVPRKKSKASETNKQQVDDSINEPEDDQDSLENNL